MATVVALTVVASPTPASRTASGDGGGRTIGDRRASAPSAIPSDCPRDSQGDLLTGDVAFTVRRSPESVKVGEAITYTIALANLGPAAACSFTVTALVSPGQTVESVSPGRALCRQRVSGTATEITCQMAFLAAGETETVTIIAEATFAGKVETSIWCGTTNDPNISNCTDKASATVRPRAEPASPVTAISASLGSTVAALFAGAEPTTPRSTDDCRSFFVARWFGPDWKDNCLVALLRDPDYFGITSADASSSALLDYTKKHRDGVATLLLQVEYGFDLNRLLAGRTAVLPHEKAFVDALGKAQSALSVLHDLVAIPSAVFPGLIAVKESLSLLTTITKAIGIYSKAVGTLTSQSLRDALGIYLSERENKDAKAAWAAVTNGDYERPIAQVTRRLGMRGEQLGDWFEAAFQAHRLARFADLRREHGRAIARQAKGL